MSPPDLPPPSLYRRMGDLLDLTEAGEPPHLPPLHQTTNPRMHARATSAG